MTPIVLTPSVPFRRPQHRSAAIRGKGRARVSGEVVVLVPVVVVCMVLVT